MTEIYYLHTAEWLKSTQATKQFEGTSNFVQLKFGVHFRLSMMMVSSPICTEQVFVCTAHLLISCGYICREGDSSFWQAFRFASGGDCNNFRSLDRYSIQHVEYILLSSLLIVGETFTKCTKCIYMQQWLWGVNAEVGGRESSPHRWSTVTEGVWCQRKKKIPGG